jgi:hypothetical protein
MWTEAISMPGKKQGIDGGYLRLSQLQRHPLVQHTPQNQCYGYRLGVYARNFYPSLTSPKAICLPQTQQLLPFKRSNHESENNLPDSSAFFHTFQTE